MVDKEKFDEQFQYFDKETIIEIINIFLNEKETRFKLLHRNLNDGDLNEFAKNSHSLKGTIGSFMAPVPLLLVSALEENAKAKDESVIHKNLRELEEACDTLAEELESIKRSL